jgi:hypothetical protein
MTGSTPEVIALLINTILLKESAMLKAKLRPVKRVLFELRDDATILLRRTQQQRTRYRLADGISAIILGTPGLHTFFGYYDISPFHADGSRILACRVLASPRVTPAGSSMQLGYYTTVYPQQFFAFATTHTWCWQQGARLQWTPFIGTDTVLFNTQSPEIFSGYGVVCRIGSGEQVSRYARLVYALHQQTGMALSLDFARLQRLRPGYGYEVTREVAPHSAAPADDGIYLMQGPEREARMIFSLKQAAELDPTPSMQEAEHYFNHLFWSPSASRFMVIHAWNSKLTGKHTRILTMTTEGSDVRPVTFFDRASHYWWLDDATLLVYGEVHGRQCYFRAFDSPRQEAVFFSSLPEGDGHPSLSPMGGWLLGDTLPDALSERTLWLYDQKRNSMHIIGTLYSPLSLRGETRCDLHPRWDASSTRIAVDSAHNGIRELLIIDIQSIVTG